MSSFDLSCPVHGWIPYKLLTEEKERLFRWMYIGEKRFSEPFFEDTIGICKSHSLNSHPESAKTTLDELMQLAGDYEYVHPAAFIFHVSRCGSTLLSQLLSLHDENIVLSEVPLIDEILRAEPEEWGFNNETKIKLLNAVVKLLFRRRSNEQRGFVKLDCWHIFHYQVLRRCYPEVPFILMYRDPGEVLQSHRKRKGSQMIPGVISPELTKISDSILHFPDPDKYVFAMLEKLYEGLLNIVDNDKNVLLLNYQDGPEVWISRLAKRLSLSFSDEEMEAVTHRSTFHSKYPGEIFQEIRHDEPDHNLELLNRYYKILEQAKLKQEGSRTALDE